jgi:hypothetical protein
MGLAEFDILAPPALQENKVRADVITLKSRLFHYATASSFTVYVMKDIVRKQLHVFDHDLSAESGGCRRALANASDPELFPIIAYERQQLRSRLWIAPAQGAETDNGGCIILGKAGDFAYSFNTDGMFQAYANSEGKLVVANWK